MDSVYVPKTFFDWEIRADRECLFAKYGKRWFKVPMSALRSCAVSYASGYTFRVTTTTNEYREFTVSKKGTYAQELFSFLQSFPFAFDKTVSTFTPHTWKYGIQEYRIDRNEFAGDVEKVFSKSMKPNFCIPTRNVQTMIQYHSYDAEGSDTFHLRVYTADGLCLNLEGDSIQHCYEIALMIKDNAPQVRYGIYTRQGPVF